MECCARFSFAGILRVQGEKHDTADEGWEKQQTSRPNECPTENQRQTAQHSREDRRAEKQCLLTHAASLTGVAGAFIFNERYGLFASVISLDVLMFWVNSSWVNSSDGVLWQRTMICASSSVS
jgi:hypothetical protein